MTYNLAKQLKDAEFPSPDKVFLMQDGMTCEGVAPDPTLSELIEACGHDFMSLEFLPIPGNSRWNVRGNRIRDTHDGVDLIEGIHGASPEEAVAKLWLALMKTPKS